MTPEAILLAEAIATAEGFYVPNSLPARTHNPGDLERGNVGGGTINGKTVYPDDAAGWLALQHQCDLMLTGNSHEYKLSDTLLEVASKYTGGDNPITWAMTVAGKLGVPMTTKLSEL